MIHMYITDANNVFKIFNTKTGASAKYLESHNPLFFKMTYRDRICPLGISKP